MPVAHRTCPLCARLRAVAGSCRMPCMLLSALGGTTCGAWVRFARLAMMHAASSPDLFGRGPSPGGSCAARVLTRCPVTMPRHGHAVPPPPACTLAEEGTWVGYVTLRGSPHIRTKMRVGLPCMSWAGALLTSRYSTQHLLLSRSVRWGPPQPTVDWGTSARSHESRERHLLSQQSRL